MQLSAIIGLQIASFRPLLVYRQAFCGKAIYSTHYEQMKDKLSLYSSVPQSWYWLG